MLVLEGQQLQQLTVGPDGQTDMQAFRCGVCVACYCALLLLLPAACLLLRLAAARSRTSAPQLMTYTAIMHPPASLDKCLEPIAHCALLLKTL